MALTGAYRKCDICGKSKYYFLSQLKSHKNFYCSLKCKLKGMSLFYTGENGCNYRGITKKLNCIFCTKEFIVTKKLRYNAKYCSKKCMDAFIKINGFSKERIENMSNAAIKNWKKPEFKKMHVKGRFKKNHLTWNKGKPVRLSPGSEFKKGYKWEEIFDPFTIKKMVKNIIKCNHKKTKPEIKLEELLKTLQLNKFKFVGDGSCIIEKFNPDFVDKKNKKIIEMFGDYWHNLPKAKKKDYFRFIVYKRNEYKTLVIWEHELQDLEMVAGKILAFEEKL